MANGAVLFKPLEHFWGLVGSNETVIVDLLEAGAAQESRPGMRVPRAKPVLLFPIRYPGLREPKMR